jgi:hypothetical protein
VAEHDRAIQRKPAETVNNMQIAVADAGGGGANPDLTAPGLVDLDWTRSSTARGLCERRRPASPSGFLLVRDTLANSAQYNPAKR